MAEEGFHLPGNSLDKLQTIMAAYAEKGENVTVQEVASLANTSKSTVSQNNKFLEDIGFLTGGNKKSVTPVGRKLGRALDLNQEDEVRSAVKELVSGTEFLSDILTKVRIQDGMERDELQKRILFDSGQSENQKSRTGALAVIDFLVRGGLLSEEDGRLTVSQERTTKDVESDQEDADVAEPRGGEKREAGYPVDAPSGTNLPNVSINIELHLPESEDPAIYNNLFKALRKNLLEPESEDE